MTNMTEWVIGGGLVALVAFILNNNREQDKRITRSYERLDETKDYQDATFTRKDVCMLLHKQITDDLTEIKVDIKTLIKNGNQYQGKEGIRGPRGRNGKNGSNK
jgi:hypothetical protein